jgi:hypothetical protein
MSVRISALGDVPAWKRDVELVERKGIGHPDTICDGVAEAFARRLCRFYLDRFGVILHQNVDKALLRAGVAAFGGGEGARADRALARWARHRRVPRRDRPGGRSRAAGRARLVRAPLPRARPPAAPPRALLDPPRILRPDRALRPLRGGRAAPRQRHFLRSRLRARHSLGARGATRRGGDQHGGCQAAASSLGRGREGSRLPPGRRVHADRGMRLCRCLRARSRCGGRRRRGRARQSRQRAHHAPTADERSRPRRARTR